ncbi:MAG: hypothetical protein Q9172_000267 [Xanthocarpia lactea]
MSAPPHRAQGRVCSRRKITPVVDVHNPHKQGAAQDKELRSVGEMLKPPPSIGRRPLTNPLRLGPFERVTGQEKHAGTEAPLAHRQQLEHIGHTEANCHQQRRHRASTPASDDVNWGPDPSPVSGEPLRPRPGFARSQDMMEGFEAGCSCEMHRHEHQITPESQENRVMQTCEPDGRDTLLALQAQRCEYLATEERRLDELVRAEDRIRELEQQNEVLTITIREMIYLEKLVSQLLLLSNGCFLNPKVSEVRNALTNDEKVDQLEAELEWHLGGVQEGQQRLWRFRGSDRMIQPWDGDSSSEVERHCNGSKLCRPLRQIMPRSISSVTASTPT